MAKNSGWLKEEMVLTLGFYKFEKTPDNKKKIKVFTEKLNFVTGMNRTPSAIDYRIGNYKYIDPDYSGKGMSGGGKNVQIIFDEYVTNEPSLDKLAQAYSNFLNGEVLNAVLNNTKKTTATSNQKTKVISSVVYNRSEKVKTATLNRAVGVCEFCKQKAPFTTIDGKPYLEVHHVISLSNNGLDNTGNTLALCPNCHRRFHYGSSLTAEERKVVDDILLKAIKELEDLEKNSN